MGHHQCVCFNGKDCIWSLCCRLLSKDPKMLLSVRSCTPESEGEARGGDMA